MTTVLMYQPATLHLLEANEKDVDRLAEAGWRRVEKYDLVAVYSPTLNDHKTVLKADVRTWLNQGYFAEPAYVYHPDHAPRVIPADRVAEALEGGWYDSPAKFPPRTETPLPTVVRTPPPKPGPSPDMTKDQLLAFAAETCGLALSPSLTKAEILAAVETASQE